MCCCHKTPCDTTHTAPSHGAAPVAGLSLTSSATYFHELAFDKHKHTQPSVPRVRWCCRGVVCPCVSSMMKCNHTRCSPPSCGSGVSGILSCCYSTARSQHRAGGKPSALVHRGTWCCMSHCGECTDPTTCWLGPCAPCWWPCVVVVAAWWLWWQHQRQGVSGLLIAPLQKQQTAGSSWCMGCTCLIFCFSRRHGLTTNMHPAKVL